MRDVVVNIGIERVAKTKFQIRQSREWTNADTTVYCDQSHIHRVLAYGLDVDIHVGTQNRNIERQICFREQTGAKFTARSADQVHSRIVAKTNETKAAGVVHVGVIVAEIISRFEQAAVLIVSRDCFRPSPVQIIESEQ